MKVSLLGILLALQIAIEAVPSDFALQVTYKGCFAETFDTFERTFTREIRPGVDAKADLELSVGQRARLFELVRSADLFSYPALFAPPRPPFSEPVKEITLTVHADDRRHTIQWVDYGDSSDKSVRLRTMLGRIMQVALELPAVRSLPDSEIFCL